MSSILGGIVGNLAGGNIGRAVVSLVLDESGYNANLEKVEAKTQTTAAGFGTAWLAGAAVATGAVLAFAKSAIDSASEHEQVIAQLTAQVGDNTGAFEEQATALQNVSGFQDEAILSADTLLKRYKLTDEQVRAAIPTVLDYARATGKSVPEAAALIGKALLGNTRALKAVGISYTSTGVAAEDYTNILSLLNQKTGGQAAAYAQTFAGKLEILSARFDDLKEAVGGELLDDLTMLSDDLIIISGEFQKAADLIPGANVGLGDMLDVLNPVNKAWEGLSAAIKWGGEQVGVTADSTEGLTQELGPAQDALVGMSQSAYDAAAASTHLSDAQKGLKDSVASAGDGILTLETTVKDTFDVSTKEMNRGFDQMLRVALRFKADMAQLEDLHLGLSRRDQVAFETWMSDRGPGAVDAFVRASAAKQQEWVDKWQRSTGAVHKAVSDIFDRTYTLHVDASQLLLLQNTADKLKQTLARGL